MQVGSLVEYIGGLENADIILLPLEKNIPYLVTEMDDYIRFSRGIKPGIKIDICNRTWHGKHMFREIQPPVTSEEILEVLQETVTLAH